MIVDLNMGWFPDDLYTEKSLRNSLVRNIASAHDYYPKVTTVPGTDRIQITLSKPRGCENINVTEKMTDHNSRLEIMDEAGVDMAVLQISVWQTWLSLELSKIFNDRMAAYIGEYPDRFLGLAVAPTVGDEDSLNELERAVKDLGLHGVLCTAHYGDLYLDEEEFRPYLKKLNELGVPVVVHHTPLPVDYKSLCTYPNLRRFYGRCVDQMTALCRILYSGLLDEFSNLKLIFTMIAGGFFAYTNLMLPDKPGMKEEMERFSTEAEKIRGYLDRNIYFDMSHAVPWGKDQLECAVKVLGADHILFAGGYTLRSEWILRGVETIRSLDITEKEKSLILGENAVRLFNIKV